MAKKQAAKKEQGAPPEIKALMNRKQVETACIIRAWHDEDFRKKLLADPKGTLESALKLKLPASTKVTIFEEKANEIRVSLPAKPAADGELSDDQLEAVAGGGRNVVENTIEDGFNTVWNASPRDWANAVGNLFTGW